MDWPRYLTGGDGKPSLDLFRRGEAHKACATSSDRLRQDRHTPPSVDRRRGGQSRRATPSCCGSRRGKPLGAPDRPCHRQRRRARPRCARPAQFEATPSLAWTRRSMAAGPKSGRPVQAKLGAPSPFAPRPKALPGRNLPAIDGELAAIRRFPIRSSHDAGGLRRHHRVKVVMITGDSGRPRCWESWA